MCARCFIMAHEYWLGFSDYIHIVESTDWIDLFIYIYFLFLLCFFFALFEFTFNQRLADFSESTKNIL